jgi:hypothetical protein
MHYIRRSYSCVLTKSSGTEPLSLTEAGTSPVALFRQKSIKVSRQLHNHRVCVCEREKEKGGKKGEREKERERHREREAHLAPPLPQFPPHPAGPPTRSRGDAFLRARAACAYSCIYSPGVPHQSPAGFGPGSFHCTSPHSESERVAGLAGGPARRGGESAPPLAGDERTRVRR